MSMVMLGYIGTVFIIAGIFLVGRKWRHALLLSMVGEASYMARELAQWPNVDWALLLLVSILLVVAADGWRRWQLPAPKPEAPTIMEIPDVIVVQAPVAFTRKDYEQANWLAVRAALLDNIRESLGHVMEQEISRRGWRDCAEHYS